MDRGELAIGKLEHGDFARLWWVRAEREVHYFPWPIRLGVLFWLADDASLPLLRCCEQRLTDYWGE
jgi:hypothetical protein